MATAAGTAARHHGRRLARHDRAHSGGSGTRWRAAVSAEHRFHITQLVMEADAQLVELRGVHSGTTPEVSPHPAPAPQ